MNNAETIIAVPNIVPVIFRNIPFVRSSGFPNRFQTNINVIMETIVKILNLSYNFEALKLIREMYM